MLNKKQKNLNRIVFFLALVGLGASFYLFITYITYSSIACLNGEGCEVVRKSTYAYILGVPMPILGMVNFLLLAFLSFLLTLGSKNQTKILKVLLLFSFFGFLFVVYLTSLEAFVIKAFCTWCLLVAAVQTTIFVLTALVFKHK